MTDNSRNSRTLIVSFVLALAVLVPLRFVESGQAMPVSSSAAVLGAKTEKAVVLPNADIEEPFREQKPAAPVAEVAKSQSGCVRVTEANQRIKELTEKYLNAEKLTMGEEQQILGEIENLELSKCQ